MFAFSHCSGHGCTEAVLNTLSLKNGRFIRKIDIKTEIRCVLPVFSAFEKPEAAIRF
jgi:hypothetical protein